MEKECLFSCEVWKDIPEYEGLYQASTLGRIKSLKRYYKTGRGGLQLLPERIRKLSIKRTGYVEVALCKNGVHRCFLVHRIIGKLFVPNPNNYEEINHKDENLKNNCADNLEWCDHSYNINYGTRTERAVKAFKSHH